MIRIRVNTIWRGQVGVRDKYVEEAEQTGQSLFIFHGLEQMIIPWLDLKRLIVGRSEKAMVDRYGKNRHYLIYYDWRPMVKQSILQF